MLSSCCVQCGQLHTECGLISEMHCCMNSAIRFTPYSVLQTTFLILRALVPAVSCPHIGGQN